MMRMFKIVVLLAFACTVANGWGTSPSHINQKSAIRKISSDVIKAVSVAGLSFALTAGSASASFDFTGSYADPNHPNCLRDITVNTKTEVATLTGTDGNPACPPDGSGNKWNLKGEVAGNTILVDFSPKGGPSDLKGIWDATTPAGIKWPDGNKWTLKDS